MSLKERLTRRRIKPKEVMEAPTAGHFVLHQNGSACVLKTGQLTELCPPPGEGISSIGIRAAKPDKLDIALQWVNDDYVCFEWGMIERFERKKDGGKKNETYIKVKGFNVGLTGANLVHQGDHYQIRDCPLSLSADLSKMYFNGALILTWVPEAT